MQVVLPISEAIGSCRTTPRVAAFRKSEAGGPQLGRLELTITLQEWLKRIPDFEIVDEAELKVNGGLVANMERLRLRWQAAGAPS